MARLAPQRKPLQPVEGMEGLFIEDLSFEKVEEMRALSDGDGEGDSDLEVFVWMGENLLRDADGNPFDDLVDEAEVRKMPISFLRELMSVVTAHISAGGPGSDPTD